MCPAVPRASAVTLSKSEMPNSLKIIIISMNWSSLELDVLLSCDFHKWLLETHCPKLERLLEKALIYQLSAFGEEGQGGNGCGTVQLCIELSYWCRCRSCREWQGGQSG